MITASSGDSMPIAILDMAASVRSTSPQNWSQYSGVKFWFYGSGEGGQLQIEIGEDKTTDVERYRAPTFVDNQLGWRLVRLDFDSFTPASWNPVPGNEVLDLLSVENIVFAANSGITSSGVRSTT